MATGALEVSICGPDFSRLQSVEMVWGREQPSTWAQAHSIEAYASRTSGSATSFIVWSLKPPQGVQIRLAGDGAKAVRTALALFLGDRPPRPSTALALRGEHALPQAAPCLGPCAEGPTSGRAFGTFNQAICAGILSTTGVVSTPP